MEGSSKRVVGILPPKCGTFDGGQAGNEMCLSFLMISIVCSCVVRQDLMCAVFFLCVFVCVVGAAKSLFGSTTPHVEYSYLPESMI